MEFKGTSGKWEIHKHAFACVISEEVSFVIANCGSASSNFENFEDKQKYNALLISKAPELLEALQSALDLLYQCECPKELHETYANIFVNYNNLIKEATEL